MIYEFTFEHFKVDDTQVVTGVCLTRNDYILPIHPTTNGALKIWPCLQGKHSLEKWAQLTLLRPRYSDCDTKMAMQVLVISLGSTVQGVKQLVN